MSPIRRVRTLAPLLIGLFILAAAAGSAGYHLSLSMGLAALQATGRHRLDLYTTSLEREIDKYAYFPATLGLERDVIKLLSGPGTVAMVEPVNSYLEQLNQRAGTLAIYVLDRRGVVLASSNWRQSDSFMGEDLSYRPYFKDAVNRGSGRFFGIGTTRGEPGYYLSSALISGSDLVGVAVVKVSLEQLEKSWDLVEAPALVADENGVVILASVPTWKFTTVRRLDDKTRRLFDQTQQYNRRALLPLEVQQNRRLSDTASLVHLSGSGADPASVFPVSGQFLAQTQPLPGMMWNLTVFSHREQIDSMAWSHAALAAIGSAFLAILLVLVNQRNRHQRDQLAAREALQRAHDDLERKVEERTADLSATNARLQEEVIERIRAERTLRAAQDELVQAGKLAVIGQLLAGIAHELNQPLAAMRTLSGNTVKFLQRGDVETARLNLGRIDQLVDSMGTLTGQLKSFSRKSSGRPRPVPVRRAIDNALALLNQRMHRANIKARIEMPDAGLWALCDPNRLEQVLVNLIANALDAMEGCSDPALELRGERDGERVRIKVRDHGPGLADDVRSHLFEPFFTTKDAGGLGLGLVISSGIVRDFGGTLAGDNDPQGGAVFTLDIPLSPDGEDECRKR
ncbi:MAG: ATP-binding protein [Azospirillaceae bacterium]|nr:ATP-binding protein [Azospirillaceae bacterium]